jgi:hypothetical protein
MKRTFALVIFLAALGVLSKLLLKPRAIDRAQTDASVSASQNVATEKADAANPLAEMLGRYAGAPERDRALVDRVADRFRQTAVAIERTDGLRGLKLLDRLDLEAVYLYEKHPKEFRRLRDVLDDDAAADVLLHWREYFGLKRADDMDRGLLVSELSNLGPAQRRLAARYPSGLPLILADPTGMAELAESLRGDEAALNDALAILSLISLDQGAADLRTGLRTIENHRHLAIEAFRQHGLEGFALVSLYGPVLESLGSALPLDQALILLRVNSDDVDVMLQTHRPETVAGYLGHVAATGLVEAVGGSPHALKLFVEFAERGEQALAKAGPDAADVVFNDYADPTLRNQAVAALGEHGSMALVILDKYSSDPDFREILRTYGGAIVPPIARADTGPEVLAWLQKKEKRSLGESLAKLALLSAGDNGQSVIRTIRNDGLERVASLDSTDLRFYQFLPLYDVIHLGNVLGRGYAPTSGEMTWALVDGGFIVADVLSLAAIQPEGALAAEAVHTEVKAAARESVRSLGREMMESGVGSAGKASSLAAGESASLATRRLARWWTVRSAGGLYQVLRRMPEAVPRMTLSQVIETARPLCSKAGMRLSTWRPIQLLREGIAVPFRIPPERGLKYVAAQMLQASVGVVGFQKMEEHLASRRPRQL